MNVLRFLQKETYECQIMWMWIYVCTFSVSDETALVMIRGAPSQRKAVCLIVWSDATYHPYHLHMKGNKTEGISIYNKPMEEQTRPLLLLGIRFCN